MFNHFRFGLLIGLLVLSMGGAALAGPLEDGRSALDQGDFATAMALLTPLAEQGDAAAQVELGFVHANAKGVAQDDVQAAKWFTLAANQGHPMAQYVLGVMYDVGQGVPKDLPRAVSLFRQASKQGHAQAQFSLAVMYRIGAGVEQDDQHAAVWFMLAMWNGAQDPENWAEMAMKNMTDEQLNEVEFFAMMCEEGNYEGCD